MVLYFCHTSNNSIVAERKVRLPFVLMVIIIRAKLVKFGTKLELENNQHVVYEMFFFLFVSQQLQTWRRCEHWRFYPDKFNICRICSLRKAPFTKIKYSTATLMILMGTACRMLICGIGNADLLNFWELLVFPCAQPLIPEPRIAYRHKTAVGEGFVLFNDDSIICDSCFKAIGYSDLAVGPL
jgi:hypothetical protein